MRQRWPRPMGVSKSVTRPHISSGSVSRVRIEFGSMETSSVNAGRCRKAPGSMPKESASEPGRAWKKGFFSIGSHCSAPT